jgi:Fe-Mn family superoxide dismutase
MHIMKNTAHTNRRTFIKVSAGSALMLGIGSSVAGSLLLSSCGGSSPSSADGESSFVLLNPFQTPLQQRPLPYGYDQLEPYIDALTMEIHYTRHAGGYATKLQEAVSEEGLSSDVITEDILSKISTYSVKMRNNAGGHYNHELFWSLMSPKPKRSPEGALMETIITYFGDLDTFKSLFKDHAMGRFGSGWAWLMVDMEGKLALCNTPNQDNPLMDLAEVKGIPLMGVDVWEHAYYLHYQNKRADYIDQWWNVLDWSVVEDRYEKVMTAKSQS